MKIVVLSGKGGTGKTTVATNLSCVLKMDYVDCDVEEPNGHIFLKPQIQKVDDVKILNPMFDKDKCVSCGACVKACQFNALAKVLDGLTLFEELCHGCGTCSLVCKNGAISEVGRKIGTISIGHGFKSGKLNVGEPMGGPIISQLKILSKDDHVIYDSSPGTSCSVVKTLDGADYAVLVTEPTKFGLHDLKLAADLVKDMNIPFGIVVNRSIQETRMIDIFCEENQFKLLGKIPFSKEAAVLYSKGKLLIENEEYLQSFELLGQTIMNQIKGRDACGTRCN